jgi:hypothetical protein
MQVFNENRDFTLEPGMPGQAFTIQLEFYSFERASGHTTQTEEEEEEDVGIPIQKLLRMYLRSYLTAHQFKSECKHGLELLEWAYTIREQFHNEIKNHFEQMLETIEVDERDLMEMSGSSFNFDRYVHETFYGCYFQQVVEIFSKEAGTTRSEQIKCIARQGWDRISVGAALRFWNRLSLGNSNTANVEFYVERNNNDIAYMCFFLQYGFFVFKWKRGETEQARQSRFAQFLRMVDRVYYDSQVDLFVLYHSFLTETR